MPPNDLRRRARGNPWSRTPLLLLSPLFAVLVIGPSRQADAGANAAPSRWQIFVGDATTDTIDGECRDVLPAAERTLEGDDWRIETPQSTGNRLVTEWKPFHHPLLRFVIGDVRARCEVRVRPLDPSRSIVTFRAGLATAKSLRDSPAFPLALAAYQASVRGFYRDLRRDLVRRQQESETQTVNGSGSPAD